MPAVFVGRFVADAVEGVRRGRFAAQVHDLRGLGLHAERHLEGGDARFKLRSRRRRGLEVVAIAPAQQVELQSLQRGSSPGTGSTSTAFLKFVLPSPMRVPWKLAGRNAEP